ncbi:hypothetical protein HAX54_040982, partial [Datura stramonium]|nr:hypothetical protein [Datura stramonium]
PTDRTMSRTIIHDSWILGKQTLGQGKPRTIGTILDAIPQSYLDLWYAGLT